MKTNIYYITNDKLEKQNKFVTFLYKTGYQIIIYLMVTRNKSNQI